MSSELQRKSRLRNFDKGRLQMLKAITNILCKRYKVSIEVQTVLEVGFDIINKQIEIENMQLLSEYDKW